MGFDYATIKHSVYDRDFLKEFGDPAPNHQWGFDIANQSFRLIMGLPLNTETRAVYKQDDWLSPNYIQDYFGKPADITAREHSEVYAWFKYHKVEWTNTPTWFQGSSTRQTADNIAYDQTDGTRQDRLDKGYGSLLDYDNPLGDYDIANQMPIFNGWIQHVANDPDQDEVDGYGNKLSGGMDFLCFRTIGGSSDDWEHSKDFNSGNGYGWGNQTQYNGEFISNAQFNVVTYGSSSSASTPHDKYFIVHLKGLDYEGWYLGLDFEADKPGANPNEIVAANGKCNDWIIKIAEAGGSGYIPCRVMCEDLGGTFDIDFNDIVYDIDMPDASHAKVIVQAAGGTMPIMIKYKDEVLCDEVHAAFGVASNVPVNVGASYGRDGLEPIELSINDFGNRAFDINDINVFVKPVNRAEWVNITLLDQTSNIPCRFCVPTTVSWTKELQRITWAFPMFVDWVKDPSFKFWEKNVNATYLYGNGSTDTPPANQNNSVKEETTPASGPESVPSASVPNAVSLKASGDKFRFGAMSAIPENATSVTLQFVFKDMMNGEIGLSDFWGNKHVATGYSTNSPLSITITDPALIAAARSGDLYYILYNGTTDNITSVVYIVGN